MYTYACTYWLADDIIRVHAYLFASVVFNVYIDVYFVFCFCMFIYVFRFSVVISLPCILDAQKRWRLNPINALIHQGCLAATAQINLM